MFWYNGKLIQSQTLELDINEPGLLYGATVFTTLRVYDNLDSSLTNWVAHTNRLQVSLQSFAWQQPDWMRLRQGAEIISAHFPILRITVFPDGREWITGRLLPNDLTEKQNNGIVAAIANPELQRSLPLHKTGNYLSAWLARATVQKLQASEAILVNQTGNWLETNTGNLWGWQDGSWWTPPLTEGILPGIMRNQLINWLEQQAVVRQEPWTPGLVEKFAAIAYTNSVVQIIPIHTVIQPADSPTLKYDPHHHTFGAFRKLFSTTGTAI